MTSPPARQTATELGVHPYDGWPLLLGDEQPTSSKRCDAPARRSLVHL
jgi:hypothetical protein